MTVIMSTAMAVTTAKAVTMAMAKAHGLGHGWGQGHPRIFSLGFTPYISSFWGHLGVIWGHLGSFGGHLAVLCGRFGVLAGCWGVFLGAKGAPRAQGKAQGSASNPLGTETAGGSAAGRWRVGVGRWWVVRGSAIFRTMM